MAVRRSEYLVGSEADWAAQNPVLKMGQLALSTPNNRMKFGDGVTPYASLPYASTGSGITGPLDGGSA